MRDLEGMRSPTPAQPVHDTVLRHRYGGSLESAAEAFLQQAFETGGRGALGDEAVPPVLVAAAMHVLNQAAWTQPSDEQVKASMFIHQQNRADEEARPPLDPGVHGEPGRRAA